MFVNYILPTKKPDLTIFWSKEPDATSHAYGPRSYNACARLSQPCLPGSYPDVSTTLTTTALTAAACGGLRSAIADPRHLSMAANNAAKTSTAQTPVTTMKRTTSTTLEPLTASLFSLFGAAYV